MAHLRVLLLALLASGSIAQAQARLTEADALMVDFATAWSADDADALRALLAADVVLLGAEPVVGADAVMAWAEGQMAASPALVLAPLYSAAQQGRVYQVGRWTLGEATGVHTFLWEADGEGQWRLASLYILDDAEEE